MKTSLSRLPLALPMLAAFAAGPALAQTAAHPTTAAPATATPATPAPATPAATTSAPGAKEANPAAQTSANSGQQTQDDAAFVKAASAGNMAEVKLGNLAMQRAETPAIREFGRWMVTDHTMAENVLQKTAQPANLPLATAPTAEQQATMNRLDGRHGMSFDHDYIDAMVQDHEQTIRTFKTEAQSGRTAALKNYAQDMLPTLQQHLDEAQDLQRLQGRYASASSRQAASEQPTAAGDREVQKLNQQELNRVEKRQP